MRGQMALIEIILIFWIVLVVRSVWIRSLALHTHTWGSAMHLEVCEMRNWFRSNERRSAAAPQRRSALPSARCWSRSMAA